MLTAIVLYVPIFTFIWLRKNFLNLIKPATINKFGILYQDQAFRGYPKRVNYLNGFFLLRIGLFGFHVLFVQLTYLKLMFFMQCCWLPYLVWYFKNKQHVERRRQNIEIFNHCMLLIVLYHYFAFFLSYKYELCQFGLGISASAFICLTFMANMICIMLET